MSLINEAVLIHNSSLVKGPPNLNGIDFLIMPCCDHHTQCYCQPPYAHNFTEADHPQLLGLDHHPFSQKTSQFLHNLNDLNDLQLKNNTDINNSGV
jgi:hypothetical protein